MRAYLSLLQDVLENGASKSDRTGIGTRSVFARQTRFDLRMGFPIVTTKEIHWHSVVHELLWFLRGDTNIAYLNQNGVSIWNEWANEKGDLGPIYGKQWRSWQSQQSNKPIDQIAEVINTLKQNPDSRRMIVSAWNVGDLSAMQLPPCHIMFQFYAVDGVLSCQLYQRSADIFLGVPFNIACYALLTHMVAHVCDMQAGEFIHVLGDAHLYNNHCEQARLQLSRTPMPLPTLSLNEKIKDIFAFTARDITLNNYQSHPRISAPVAV